MKGEIEEKEGGEEKSRKDESINDKKLNFIELNVQILRSKITYLFK